MVYFIEVKSISTHTPHARRDIEHTAELMNYSVFQLTRLMRGVTIRKYGLYLREYISTHTPHARRDLVAVSLSGVSMIFQLTRLMRGVTASLYIRI